MDLRTGLGAVVDIRGAEPVLSAGLVRLKFTYVAGLLETAVNTYVNYAASFDGEPSRNTSSNYINFSSW